MRYIPIILILSLTNIGNIYAKVPLSVQLKLYEAYVDNIFQTAIPDSDYITLMYLNADYGLNANNTISYNTNMGFFRKNKDLQYQLHSLGTNYQKSAFDDKGIIYLGGGLGFRDNAQKLKYYDYQNAGLYSVLKYYFSETAYTQLEYNNEYKNRNNNSDYNSFENFGAIMLSKSFNTKTTIQGRIEAGHRDYLKLKGKYDSRSTKYIKIAQSLTEFTGLQFQYRWHIASQILPYSFEFLGGYNQLDDLEDEYIYSGSQWQLTLKSYTIWDMVIKGVFVREKRLYNFFMVFDDYDIQERNDKITSFMLGIDKKLLAKSRFLPDSTLSVEFIHRNNNSSNPFYKSSTNILSFGIVFSF